MKKRARIKKRAYWLVLIMVGLFVNINLVFSQSAPSFGGGYGQTFAGGYRVYGPSINPQFVNPSFLSRYGYTSPGIYWPKFNREDCYERQDFIMQIVPGGCNPPVVRSDLLEEQNVPVFCKVMSVQTNPLIEVSRIRSIRFKGEYPKGVSGVSYFPARAALGNIALRQKRLVSSPVNDNLGYLVIVLSRQEVEGEMPDFVDGNITALVDYDVEGAFGVGNTNFYVPQTSDKEWFRDYREYGFWNGKGYIRADSIESDRATISVYRDVDSRVSSVTLREGETSKDIYLTGFYCSAGLNIKLESLKAPVESALLQINDEQVWVSKGDRIIDGKCRITYLEVIGRGGKVSVSCPVQNGKFELSLSSGKAGFLINENFIEHGIGAKIDYDRNVYLGYLGEDKNNKKFAVLVKDDFSDNEAEFAEKKIYSVVDSVVEDKSVGDLKEDIKNAVKSQYKSELKANQKAIDEKVEIEVISEGETGFGISLSGVLVSEGKDWSVGNLSEADVLALEYYNKGIESYEDLADFYPNEKMQFVEEDPYAAMGLYEAAKLSKKFGMNQKAQEFYDRLLKEYPESGVANSVVRERELLIKYDTSNAKAVVNMNNQQYFIDLLDFKKPTKKEMGAVLMIDGEEKVLGLKDTRVVARGENGTRRIQVDMIKDDYIIIKYDRGNSSKIKSEKLDLMKKDQAFFDGVNIKLVAINVDKQAKLVITPKAFGPRGESNFKFRIGIEKRAIKLSPEQTEEMMSDLLEVIKMWNDVNVKLGNVVKAMKGACFATSAILTTKNFFEGLSGESIARNGIMTGLGGWNDECERLVNEGEYQTVQQCILAKKSEINSDVEIYSSEIKKTNNIIKDIQKKVGIERQGIFDFKGQVNSKKVEGEFKKVFEDFCKSADGEIELPDKSKTKVPLTGEKGVCSWESLTHEQRKEIMTLYNARNSGSGVLNNMTNKKLGNIVLNAKNYEEVNEATRKADENNKKYGLGIDPITPVGDIITYGDVKIITKGDSEHNIYKNFKIGDGVVRILIPHKKVFGSGIFTAHPEVAGKEVVVQVEGVEGSVGIYILKGKVYHLDGKEVTGNASNSVKEYMSLAGIGKIKDVDRKAYQNPMLNPDKLVVKYFERAPYKGLPAEVPFDVENGWYAEMTYVLTGFGKPYDESGRVVNFYICNVGENGLIEFKKSADDICRYYNGDSQSGLNFPGLSSGDSLFLVQKAQQAIADASRQYGKERVVINGRTYKSGISFGGEEGRCTNFMSPGDCHLLFNVCDPVICPASRCDLGGRYRVDNVIQTGVIGSLLLCLPNFREGIAMPICLTGVHAGIEGYTSILNSTVACLNESLVTGRNIGICDEIKSIYLCEFFWKQASPFLEVVIPNVFGGLYGEVRGGGEYSTVLGAWENSRNAINYFKNEYAVNSMLAFHARSTEEIGGDFCKAFVSVNFPDMKNFFEVLIEPDSPEQYYAWFSENVLTTATIPPMSHYKVYYHIYAGKDFGAYYAVYLKDLPESYSIRPTGYYVVDRGYVPRGSQVDEARDFTAASGYRQLCISVNGKDECGFGKVSSSYALNSLTDSYAKEQIKTDIISEKECIAGTPSVFSLAQPNVQAGVEEIINPELYRHGIIRVCSTENPGKQVTLNGKYDRTNSSYDRWKEVGYCDDPTIRCWLDTESVKNVIRDKGIEEQVLSEVDLNVLDEIDYLGEVESRAIADEVEEYISYLIIMRDDDKEIIEAKIKYVVDRLDKLVNLGSSNVHRARGLYLFGRLYKKVAESLLFEEEVGDAIIDKETWDTRDKGNNGKIEWADDMLRENIRIVVNDLSFGGKKQTAYLYKSGRWISKDAEFVKKNLGYVDGINYLLEKSSFVGDSIEIEGVIINSKLGENDEEMAEKIFRVLS